MIMRTPYFTIIIVVFNGEKTLQTAIDSVCVQTYADFELLVIDGLSTDKTMDIIHVNAAKDSRIKFVSEKDEGIYDAMNKGIKMSRGRWLYFLGSDDRIYDKYVLGKIAPIASDSNLEVIYGDVFLLPGQKTYGGIFSMEVLMTKNISHQAIFYKSHIFQKVGYYNITYSIYADWDFNIRCFKNPGIIHQHIDVIIAYFKKGGVSNRSDKLFLREVLVPLFTTTIRAELDILKRVTMYDRYWRLLRNAGISNEENRKYLPGKNELPNVVLRIILLQKRISPFLLRMGLFSKFFMIVSYLENRLKRFE